MWKLEADVQCLPWLLSTLCFETRAYESYDFIVQTWEPLLHCCSINTTSRKTADLIHIIEHGILERMRQMCVHSCGKRESTTVK